MKETKACCLHGSYHVHYLNAIHSPWPSDLIHLHHQKLVDSSNSQLYTSRLLKTIYLYIPLLSHLSVCLAPSDCWSCLAIGCLFLWCIDKVVSPNIPYNRNSLLYAIIQYSMLHGGFLSDNHICLLPHAHKHEFTSNGSSADSANGCGVQIWGGWSPDPACTGLHSNSHLNTINAVFYTAMLHLIYHLIKSRSTL